MTNTPKSPDSQDQDATGPQKSQNQPPRLTDEEKRIRYTYRLKSDPEAWRRAVQKTEEEERRRDEKMKPFLKKAKPGKKKKK